MENFERYHSELIKNLVENDLKVVTEALIRAAWEQGLQTSYLKHYIDKSTESPV